MGTDQLHFKHHVIDADPPGCDHDVTLLFDIDGDGRTDILVAGKSGEMFWYRNPDWERHLIACVPDVEAGGAVVDINGDGRLDIVVGQQYNGNELWWLENPEDPTGPWTRRLIENRFLKYHDQLVGDIDQDGEPEIVAVSQRAGVLFYYDIPSDPTVEPWPVECYHQICDQLEDIEGLAVVDIDNDGVNELLAGPNIFKRRGGSWERTCFAPGFTKTRLAVADLDGDGTREIVLAEGESNPGRLAICRAPDWQPHVLRDDLFHPHSLEIADFNGDGTPDIFIAEMGLGKCECPRMYVLLNRGDGTFDECLVSAGIPTHEAKLADLTGNGLPDIVGKPYSPERHIDVWYNETT